MKSEITLKTIILFFISSLIINAAVSFGIVKAMTPDPIAIQNPYGISEEEKKEIQRFFSVQPENSVEGMEF